MITVLVVLFVEFITVNCTAQCIRKAHGVQVTILVLIYEDTDCGFIIMLFLVEGLDEVKFTGLFWLTEVVIIVAVLCV